MKKKKNAKKGLMSVGIALYAAMAIAAPLGIAMFNFFFFSRRRRHTRCGRDWSSDVCSSDLSGYVYYPALDVTSGTGTNTNNRLGRQGREWFQRSEERRVGKECRSRWSPY